MNPRTAKQIFIATCVGYFSFGLLNASLGPLLQSFAARNSVDLATIGAIFTALCAGELLSQVAIGPFTDRLGHQRCLAISFIFLAVFLAAATFSSSFPLTLALVFLAGMGYGLAVLTGNTLVTRVYEENSISALNWINVFFGVGDVVGPLLVSLSLTLWANGMPAIWFGSLVMLATAAVFILGFFKLNIGSQTARVDSPDTRMNLTPFLLTLASMILVYVGTEGSVGNWTTTYLNRTVSMPIEKAALVTSGFWLALTLGRLMGALLGSRVRAVDLLKLCLGSAFTGAVIFMLSYGHEVWSIAAICFIGFGFGAIFPTIFGIMTAKYKHNSGKPGSLLSAMASTSGMTLPWLVGVTFARFGMRSMTFFVAGLIGLLIIVFLLNQASAGKTRNGN